MTVSLNQYLHQTCVWYYHCRQLKLFPPMNLKQKIKRLFHLHNNKSLYSILFALFHTKSLKLNKTANLQFHCIDCISMNINSHDTFARSNIPNAHNPVKPASYHNLIYQNSNIKQNIQNMAYQDMTYENMIYQNKTCQNTTIYNMIC